MERNVEKTQKKKKCEKREADRRKIVVNKTNGSHVFGHLLQHTDPEYRYRKITTKVTEQALRFLVEVCLLDSSLGTNI